MANPHTKHTIHRYPLVIADGDQELMLPRRAAFLHAAVRPSEPGLVQLWFEVDAAAPLRAHRFRVFGTGHPFDPSTYDLLATVLGVEPEPGQYVWHVLENRAALEAALT